MDNNAEPVDHNMDDLNRTTRLRRLSASEKRHFIVAFLKVIMPDGQPQPLGQDEKDCLLRVVSDLSISLDERQELCHWVAVKYIRNPEISEAKSTFAWMDTDLKKNLLIDIFAYLDTNNGRSRKGKIIASAHFKELCKEFTDDEIRSLRKDAYQENQKPEEKVEEKVEEEVEEAEGIESDIEQNEEIQISEDSNDRNEKTETRWNDEKSDQDDDMHRMGMKERLRKAKSLATGLLVAMAAIFISHRFFAVDYLGSELVVAFAGAALIGGLADWYAVTALFRNPLYIPKKFSIPHTAIVSKRKNEIGEELARFICKNILTSEVIEDRLINSKLTYRLGKYLQDEMNAKYLGQNVSKVIDYLICNKNNSELRDGVKNMLAETAKDIPVNKALAAIIDVLATDKNAQNIISELANFIEQQINHNRESIIEYIRKNLKEESGWIGKVLEILNLIGSSTILKIIRKFLSTTNPIYRIVDAILSILPMLGIGKKEKISVSDKVVVKIYDTLEKECKEQLKKIQNDQNHPIRIEIDNRLRSWSNNLINDSDMAKRCEILRDEFIRNENAQIFFKSIWNKAQSALHTELESESSDIRQRIEREIQHIGKIFSSDDEISQSIDRWLIKLITEVVESNRDEISRIISDTIKEWDADTVAEIIELQIGKDLQFIRINGTVVGGFIGIAIYLLTGFVH